MKRILGLDLGTNSIGWALVEILEDGIKRIVKLGSRIVPMDGAEMSNFKKGLPQTKNAKKREKKGARVGNKRYKQRRNKLIYVLQKLDMLPEQIKLSEPFLDPLRIQKINILPIEEKTEQLTANEFLELKVKAIHNPLADAKDFGRILYRFNQLRGYAGGDDEDIQDELNEVLGIKSDKIYPAQVSRILPFKIIEFKATDEKSKKKTIYFLKVIDNDLEEWEGTTLIDSLTIGETIELRQLIRQNTKTGKVTSTEFSIPKKSGWRKKMENLEEALDEHCEEKGRKTYLSEFFLDSINEGVFNKIRDNVILRARYQEEFDAIWDMQFERHIKNVKKETIEEIAYFLFPGIRESQQKLRQEAVNKGLKHIIRDQIIYFQRRLKDQSHLISECRFERGEKAIAKSHPLFQEYKIWEQINKLSITRRIQKEVRKNGKPKYEYLERNISSKFKEYLYEELQDKKELAFSTVFNQLKKQDDFNETEDFFNGLDKKSKLIGNTTKISLKKRLGRFWEALELDNIENQIEMWSLLYNGKGNEYDLESQRNRDIAKYLKEKGINDKDFEKIVVAISCIKFPRNYASISLLTVKKALPLVRAGKYFSLDNFTEQLNDKITKLLNEFTDDPYELSLQNYLENNESIILTEGGFLNAHALMLLYGQHTAKEITDNDIIQDLNKITPIKQNSLRNPLVEQMINETLMVVKDIWRQHGKPDEIRIELARELQNSAKERVKINEANQESRKENERIKKRLSELKHELSSGNIEKYKLWTKQRNTTLEYIEKYDSTKSEIEKMKLWEQQGHIDPYTGKPIPLSLLFNKGAYDVDHIIPKSRYFDDSFGNKVVCARKVNEDKGNRTAMEYFDVRSVKCDLLSKEEFMKNAATKFFGKKRKFMLATEIPDNPIERQKKETQYITIKVKEELAKIVGTANLKTSSGGVTHYLRNHWGITDVFKKLLEERFLNFFELKAKLEFDKVKKDYIKQKLGNKEENNFTTEESFCKEYLNQLAKSHLNEKNYKSFISDLNVELTQEKFEELYIRCHSHKQSNNLILKGYSKRYDHRHHAMDALIVAVTDQKAVKRLNDLNKHLQDWLKDNLNQFDLDLKSDNETLLENFLELEENIRKKVLSDIDKFRNVKEPWTGFQKDAKEALEDIIVSHKPKDKILIQNKEEKDKSGNIKKTKEQTIRIRGALHEDTIYGLSEEKYEAYRIPLTKFAGSQFDTMGNIEKITNKFLKGVIRDHFISTYNKSKTDAFNEEGLLALNKKLSDRVVIKNGEEIKKPHPPISSVKVYRKAIKDKNKYEISLQKLDRTKSYNKSLYVNSGNNYLFAILEKNGERIYDIVSFFRAVEFIKDKFKNTIDKTSFDKEKIFKEYFERNNSDEKGEASLLFTLKQLDMVYLPDESEEVVFDQNSPFYNDFWNSKERVKNFFTVEKFSGKEIYFLPHTTAEVIEKKVELGSQDKLQHYNGRKIVKYCFPVDLDRLGSFIKVKGDIENIN